MKRNKRMDMAYLEKIGILFFIGIVLAIIFSAFYNENCKLFYLEFNKKMYQIIENEKFKKEQFFLVCLNEVICEILWIWFFSCTFFSNLYHIFLCLKKGFMVGFLFWISIATYGFKNGIIMIFLYLPHGLIYAMVLIINILISRECRADYKKAIRNIWKCIWWCLVIIFLIFLGVCFESGLHIDLLRSFLKGKI